MRRISKCGVCLKSDPNLTVTKSKCIWNKYTKNETKLTVTKSKCIWNKYTKNETMKIISSTGIYNTIYHYVSYLLSFKKRK